MNIVKRLLDYRGVPYNKDCLYVFSGNSYITKENKLVMGRGAAKQVRDLYPGIDERLAKSIDHLSVYGLVIYDNIAVLQVKRHFKDNADIDILRLSCSLIEDYWPTNMPVFMNYPGIGNGGLSKGEVFPVIERELRDNVWVFHE
jgi:hypothetical protein